MIYYKELNIPNYDIIVKKSLDFVKQNAIIFNREWSQTSFYAFNFKDFITAVPEAELAFKEYDLICTWAGAYVMHSPLHTNIHAEIASRLSRINLPLLNCENTFTEFYSGCQMEKLVNPQSGFTSYAASDTTNAKLEAKVEVKGPTILRITQPHRVELPKDNPVPRITLSLNFDKDPTYLMDDSIKVN